jgi:hypothetical protein
MKIIEKEKYLQVDQKIGKNIGKKQSKKVTVRYEEIFFK